MTRNSEQSSILVDKQNLGILNTYRTQLFGIGVLGVFLVHSLYFFNTVPSIVTKAFGYGSMGVVIFAFLSGIGLYQSLSRNVNLGRYYKNRIVRVIIPYLLIGGIFYAWRDIIYTHSVGQFFYDLSLLSFWMDHKGAWYVAWMIPIYILYPIYYKWCKCARNRIIPTVISISVVTIGSFFLNAAYVDILIHLQNLIVATLAFIIGSYFGNAVKNKEKIRLPFFIVCLSFSVIKKFIPFESAVLNIYAYTLTGVALCVLSAIMLDVINQRRIDKVLSFLGKMSLELYLTNIFLITIYKLVKKDFNPNGNNYGYIYVIVGGIILSWLFSITERKLLSNTTNIVNHLLCPKQKLDEKKALR